MVFIVEIAPNCNRNLNISVDTLCLLRLSIKNLAVLHRK